MNEKGRTGILVLVVFLLGAVAAPAAELDGDKPKVILIGIDGISLNLLEPLSERGVIPNIEALAAEGGWWKLHSYWPLRTMQVWTSVVTGKLPGQHGIWDHLADSTYNPPEYRTKERKVYTPANRKSRALWQLLGQHGLKTLVVGWPTTWPAEKVEHATIVAPKVLYGDARRVTIKGSLWRHVADAVQPASLWPEVRKLIVEPKDVPDGQLATLADIPPKGSPLYELPRIESYVYALRWSIARARSVEAVALGVQEQTRPDVMLVYFQCTDSLLHRFWIFQKSEEAIRERLEQFKIATGHVPELKKRFSAVVENCYRDVDARMGRILEAARGSNTLVLVVSDHGFGDGPKPHPFKAEPYGGIHWSDGAVIAAGGRVAKGARVEGIAAIDITPTLLWYLALPVGADMRGKVVRDLFDPEFVEKQPEKKIETYEKEPQIQVPYPEGYPPKPKSFIW